MAPAKLNLTLEVLGRRPDGFHEIRSVVQTVGLFDDFSFRPGEGLEIKSRLLEWLPEKSLVSRAAGLLAEVTGCRKGAIIEVEKRIPLVSGLGGDSSDAAATLRGLDRLWETRLSAKELLELADRLGSDVPLFLRGGTMLAEGRGEKITSLPSILPTWFVIVLPTITRLPGKTAWVYARLRESEFTDGEKTQRLIEKLKDDKKVSSQLFFNVFERNAYEGFPSLGDFRDRMLSAGARSVHLTGTGPALFTMMEDRSRGEELSRRLRGEGLETHLVRGIDADEYKEEE